MHARDLMEPCQPVKREGQETLQHFSAGFCGRFIDGHSHLVPFSALHNFWVEEIQARVIILSLVGLIYPVRTSVLKNFVPDLFY